MHSRTLAILIALASALTPSLAWATTPAGASDTGTTTLTLRSVVRTEAPETLRVGDVARIEGPRADAVARVALPATETATITPNDVRSALIDAGVVREDEIALRGRACRIVVRRTPQVVLPAAPTLPEPEAPERPAGEIVLDRVRAHLAASLRVPMQDLRLDISTRDTEDLHRLVAGLRGDVRTTGFSRRMPVAIELFDGQRRVWEGTPRVGVEVRRSVATAAGPLGRGSLLEAQDLISAERWLAPDDDAMTRKLASGQRLRSRVDPGEAIRWRDVERPTLVERGDIVMVRSAVGAASVRLRARARADAYEGDTIDFETVGPRGKARTIRATVTGPGRAVLMSEERD